VTAGQLAIYVGSTQAAFEHVQPLLAPLGTNPYLLVVISLSKSDQSHQPSSTSMRAGQLRGARATTPTPSNQPQPRQLVRAGGIRGRDGHRARGALGDQLRVLVEDRPGTGTLITRRNIANRQA
jgi:hypothetical protein